MIRRVLVTFAAVLVSASLVQAQPTVEKGTIKHTVVTDGPGMFKSYCAVCHGTSGVGDGPAASALTKVPADLTKLSARNKGQFPEVRVKRYIEGLDQVASHGSRDMPMWGDLFRSIGQDSAVLRVQALSDYLKQMQK